MMFDNNENAAENFFELLVQNEQESVRNDVKFLLDVSYSIFFNHFDTASGDQYVANFTKSQAEQTVKWFEKYYIPFYESFEEFEKCERLKKAAEQIKRVKNLK